MPIDEDGKEGEANARLIAAAPKLVEALKVAHDALCRGWGDAIDFATIRAALEKAGVEL
jgi:hypothetical protein